MGKKTWSLILKAPALLLLIASFLAGIYAAIYEIQGMSWEVPIILGVVIFLYFIGSNLERKHYKELKEKPVKKIKEIETDEDSF